MLFDGSYSLQAFAQLRVQRSTAARRLDEIRDRVKAADRC
jgi:hypothetical protein